MKRIFNNFSIRKKYISIILAVVLFAIATVVIVLGAQDIETFRKHLVTKIESVTKVIGTNSVVAIEFEDKPQGEKILRSLNAIPEVSGAVIYDKSDREFVCFKKETELSFKAFQHVKGKRIRFVGGYLYVTDEIRFNDEFYGTISVVASTRYLSMQISDYLLFSSVLLVGIFAVAAILGAWFSKKISGPILNLANTASVISDKHDYSIRVDKINNDEIGQLYDSFNNMLDQIAVKDHEIRKLNESLEDKVKARTTDLLEAKEQAEKARRRAELADQTKSTFLANMSHEIRTPMNAILGYSKLLTKMVSGKTKQEYLDIVQTSGKNLLALINDILDLSKIESGKLNLVYKPINIHFIFNEILNIFKIKTEEKGIEFIIQVDPQIPASLILDEIRLRQILFNIVGNAVKFTEEGYVKMAVSKKMSLQDNSRIDLIFQVEDTGMGIAAEQVERIFKAFEQQKEQSSKYGGTGLGLAITKRLVEIMNGEISVKSDVGKGAAFKIELKGVEISSFEVESSFSALSTGDEIIFDNAHILLVEDNLYNLKLVRAMLEEKKIRVTEALNGREALDKLGHLSAEAGAEAGSESGAESGAESSEESKEELKGKGKPNAILMDIKMPVMDGYEATTAIKSDARFKDIPVIAFTADLMKEGKKRIEEVGFNGFLSKPIDENNLITELMKHLPHRKKTVEDKSAAQKDAAANELENAIPQHLSPQRLSQLTEVLAGQMMTRWNRLGEYMLLDEWVDLGETIKMLGNEFDVPILVNYGDHLVGNVKHLNIVELKKTIKKFPRIVEIFEKGSQS